MLPDIADSLSKVLDHFAPIAKQAYPELGTGRLAMETYDLAEQWLKTQLAKAYNEYRKNQGLEVYV